MIGKYGEETDKSEVKERKGGEERQRRNLKPHNVCVQFSLQLIRGTRCL